MKGEAFSSQEGSKIESGGGIETVKTKQEDEKRKQEQHFQTLQKLYNFKQVIANFNPKIHSCDQICTSIHALGLPNKQKILSHVESLDDLLLKGDNEQLQNFLNTIKQNISLACDQKINEMSVSSILFTNQQTMSLEFSGYSRETETQKKPSFTQNLKSFASEIVGISDAGAAELPFQKVHSPEELKNVNLQQMNQTMKAMGIEGVSIDKNFLQTQLSILWKQYLNTEYAQERKAEFQAFEPAIQVIVLKLFELGVAKLPANNTGLFEYKLEDIFKHYALYESFIKECKSKYTQVCRDMDSELSFQTYKKDTTGTALDPVKTNLSPKFYKKHEEKFYGAMDIKATEHSNIALSNGAVINQRVKRTPESKKRAIQEGLVDFKTK